MFFVRIILKILKSKDEMFSDERLEKIIERPIQKHKEVRFEYKMDLRFDIWYKIIKKFSIYMMTLMRIILD